MRSPRGSRRQRHRDWRRRRQHCLRRANRYKRLYMAIGRAIRRDGAGHTAAAAARRARWRAAGAVRRARRAVSAAVLPVARHLRAQGASTVGELAARTGVSQPAMTQTLAEMRARGLVAAERPGRRVRLTAEGEALCARLEPVWRAVERGGGRARSGAAGAARRDRSRRRWRGWRNGRSASGSARRWRAQ